MADNIREVRGAWPAVFVIDGPVMAWPEPNGSAGVIFISGRPVVEAQVDLKRLAAWCDQAGRKGGAT